MCLMMNNKQQHRLDVAHVKKEAKKNSFEWWWGCLENSALCSMLPIGGDLHDAVRGEMFSFNECDRSNSTEIVSGE